MADSNHQSDPLITRIVELAQHNPDIKLLWLYGSRAVNNAGKNSDYDLAVAFGRRLEDPIDRRLQPELLALDWQQVVGVADHMLSVVDINLAPLALALNIVGESSKLLVNKDELRYIKELNRIWGLWSDSQWQVNQLYTGEQKQR